MELNDQQLIDIADRMLADLQKQYLEIQQCNLPVQCPEDEHQDHSGYERLEGDEEQNEEDEPQAEENQEKGQNKQGQNNENTTTLTEEKAAPIQPQNTIELVELVEVFPTEEWVPEYKEVNINAQKIKQMTLQMNLPIPAWLQDQELLRNRVYELFGKGRI